MPAARCRPGSTRRRHPPVSPELLTGALADTGNKGRAGTVTNVPIPGGGRAASSPSAIGEATLADLRTLRRHRGAPGADPGRARRPAPGAAAWTARRRPAGRTRCAPPSRPRCWPGTGSATRRRRTPRGCDTVTVVAADAGDPAVTAAAEAGRGLRRGGGLGPRPDQHPEQREEPRLAGRAGRRPARRPAARHGHRPRSGGAGAGGFGGVLAVGGGSASPPRVVVADLPAPGAPGRRIRSWSARASPSTPAASRSSPTPACGR